jgi:glycine dehydrogenase
MTGTTAPPPAPRVVDPGSPVDAGAPVDVDPDDFSRRHIGPDAAEQAAMLATLGFDSLDALIDAAVPSAIRSDDGASRHDGAALPAASSEAATLARLRTYAQRNQPMVSMIGQGYHDTVTPPVILRNLLENPGWYTAYTPYQPEISQGRLEALLNFQTMIADLAGLPLANASLLDEGTAAAEAMTLCRRASRQDSTTFFVDAQCHPQTIDVVTTRAEPLGLGVKVGDPLVDLDEPDCFAVLVQYPGTTGSVRDLRGMAARVHDAGGLVVVAADPLALVLLAPPGEWGADVVVGSAQRFGVPMGFGGPHAGFMATTDDHRRTLPGRLVGVSVDDGGRRGLRLALQTREQHIRREKATSNICTAQVLLANIAGCYAVYHGPDGLAAIAGRVHHHARVLAAGIDAAGLTRGAQHFFDTVAVQVPGRADQVLEAANRRGINLRRVDADTVAIACDEVTEAAHIEAVWAALGIEASYDTVAAGPLPEGLPGALGRTGPLLDHPVFNTHHSETEMLRYLRELCDRDLALDRTMIPLGSCTMKLNATVEMIPVTWPEFARMHPFAPPSQTEGYRALIADLEGWLATICGYDAVSLQPNAGSQGEYAGLLAIRAYHRSRGEGHRDVCLIPASAHGTNPASAAMAAMSVVVVACDDAGNIDTDDLRAKLAAHDGRVAALMVTYPSTHGVFEDHIVEVCDLIHEAGGQVYLDGANLNALVGLARPGKFGSDVSHLNLHKTFCIPHGGGGPGVGPIGVGAHLAPFLPTSRVVTDVGPDGADAVISAAPWGSAGILPISWAYISLMGPDGLRRATEVAILAANYVARRLGDHYPVLYTGAGGLVAHECILDLRPLKESSGITVDDVAKRLMDYGFHAPTMSFPVAGTLMVEPTESEPKAELDRFCDAMIAIRGEIDRVAAGEWPRDDNPLVRAPHTAEDVTADSWDRAYGREEAAYPVASLRRAKYWPPVGRIDAGHGDRNLVCACPPVEDWQD